MLNNLKGKEYKRGESISANIELGENKTSQLIFDVSSCILQLDENKFKLQLPQGATLTKIGFHDNFIKLDGQVAFFSGSGQASYEDFIDFLNLAIEKGGASLNTSSGTTKLTKIA